VSRPNAEFSLIDWFRSQASAHDRLSVGIGDDTASLRISDCNRQLVTVDMLLEGVHFRIPDVAAADIGRKALAVNLSDIAAMAGRPTAAVVSVALSRNHGTAFAKEMFTGLKTLADEFDVAIAGGDTNIWDGPSVISVTVLGEVTGSEPVLRSGARSGDWIMTTGSFGGSLLGKHFSFQPRVTEALALHETVALHAMIDVSDGLAADLHHILDESSVGAIIDEQSVPISDAVKNDKSPIERALGDGEDFELLFTVSDDDGQRLLSNQPFDVKLTKIGVITESNQCQLRNASGRMSDLPPRGWEHIF